ncbi:Repeat domain-containing protein [Reichenbachiella faecimaris]|uniref:Repeat domain-containing protein n=1 Tax=Reichenbachiella faecimaris TaxID=692418 RepID=A0A1W2GL31_REIFA|nr:CRTAC1 family protein [Reichenbachiella faecimaris]SMD37369.1 Repeat domain-containing protein [Reichenbachiella faecimaris]
MRHWFIVLMVCVALGSCNDNIERRTASTIQMAAELDSLEQKARKNNNYPYFTDNLLHKLEINVHGLPYTMKFGQWLDYVLVMMLKGDNDKCIAVIDKFLDSNHFDKINKDNVDFYKMKALAHLRKGEIENCIQNHSGQSCIMPIKEKGIHVQVGSAESALNVYQKLLAYDTTDMQSRWFLNLCYQAVGQYPDAVPEQFLIPVEAFQSEIEFPVFPNISMETGVDLNNHAGGASIEDFNNDGLLDIFTTSYSLGEQSTLFLNDGMGGFVDSTEHYGLTGMVGGLNNIHADFNNDGLTDIYIMRGAWLARNGLVPNSMLLNKGGYFSDETRSAGIYQKQPTGTVAVTDFNLDGHLDLFVGNESSGRKAVFPSQLFMNNGDGTFMDVAEQLGLEINQFVKGATWGDINNDGWPDLYLSIYGRPNKLFVNKGETNAKNWIFEEISKVAGVDEPLMSFPTWFWDYNQDGWQDIMVMGYDNRESHLIASEVARDYLDKPFKGETPRLYRNNGDETFTDVTEEVGLDRLLYVMGGNFGDLNNDGYPDCYLGTGEFNIWASIPNRAFLNLNGAHFADVTTAGEFGQIQKGHGVAFGDLDNDGDQDIYHQVGGAAESDVFQNMLFHNPGFQNNWLTLKLEGTSANRSAIGAKIEVHVTLPSGNQRKIYHYVGTGGSFGSNTLRAEIGLGDAVDIDRVVVYWPDHQQSKQVIKKLEMNQFFNIIQGKEPEQINLSPLKLRTKSSHEHHH